MATSRFWKRYGSPSFFVDDLAADTSRLLKTWMDLALAPARGITGDRRPLMLSNPAPGVRESSMNYAAKVLSMTFTTGVHVLALRQLAASQRSSRSATIGSLIGVAGVALAGAAVIAHRHKREAERRYPPLGRFVSAGGARLHYVEQGRGPPCRFLHGNG